MKKGRNKHLVPTAFHQITETLKRLNKKYLNASNQKKSLISHPVKEPECLFQHELIERDAVVSVINGCYLLQTVSHTAVGCYKKQGVTGGFR